MARGLPSRDPGGRGPAARAAPGTPGLRRRDGHRRSRRGGDRRRPWSCGRADRSADHGRRGADGPGRQSRCAPSSTRCRSASGPALRGHPPTEPCMPAATTCTWRHWSPRAGRHETSTCPSRSWPCCSPARRAPTPEPRTWSPREDSKASAPSSPRTYSHSSLPGLWASPPARSTPRTTSSRSPCTGGEVTRATRTPSTTPCSHSRRSWSRWSSWLLVASIRWWGSPAWSPSCEPGAPTTSYPMSPPVPAPCGP